jgi:hypothetical protein
MLDLELPHVLFDAFLRLQGLLLRKVRLASGMGLNHQPPIRLTSRLLSSSTFFVSACSRHQGLSANRLLQG